MSTPANKSATAIISRCLRMSTLPKSGSKKTTPRAWRSNMRFWSEPLQALKTRRSSISASDAETGRTQEWPLDRQFSLDATRYVAMCHGNIAACRRLDASLRRRTPQMQRERAMRTLKIFAVAATILVVIPAVAQEMGGGPIGPGSDRGLQPSYHGGYYYDGYWSHAFWPDRFGGGPISGAVGTAGAIAAPPFVGLGGDG